MSGPDVATLRCPLASTCCTQAPDSLFNLANVLHTFSPSLWACELSVNVPILQTRQLKLREDPRLCSPFSDRGEQSLGGTRPDGEPARLKGRLQ